LTRQALKDRRKRAGRIFSARRGLSGRIALTAFRHRRIIEFRDELSEKAIAVFYFWQTMLSLTIRSIAITAVKS